MSEREWGHQLTLIGCGLVVGLTLAGPFLANMADDLRSNVQVENRATAKQQGYKTPVEPLRPRIEAPADPGAYGGPSNGTTQAQQEAGGEFKWWRDTFPQWGMFAVSFAALIFSVWAVIILWDTLRLQRRATGVQLRPYVQLKSVYTTRHRHPESEAIVSYQIDLRWENSGQTPARHMVTYATVRHDSEPMIKGYHFPDGPRPNGPRSMAPLGAGDFREAPITPRPISDLVKCWRGEIHYYIYGWAEYSDGFPKTPRYRTEFAFKVNVLSDPRQEQAGIEYEILDAHNGMDEECLFLPTTEN